MSVVYKVMGAILTTIPGIFVGIIVAIFSTEYQFSRQRFREKLDWFSTVSSLLEETKRIWETFYEHENRPIQEIKNLFKSLEDSLRSEWINRPNNLSEGMKHWFTRMINRFRHLQEVSENTGKHHFKNKVHRLFDAVDEVQSEIDKVQRENDETFSVIEWVKIEYLSFRDKSNT